jgi:hypothetical protein
MPRGIDPAILAALNANTIDGGIFFLFDVELRSGTRYWSKRQHTYGGNAYLPRILGISDLQFQSDSEVHLTVSNIAPDPNETITALSQNESFYGCRITIRLYVASLNTATVVWKGWLDEPEEMDAAEASLVCYPDTPGMRLLLPGRPVGLTCPHELGSAATYPNFVSTSEPDGGDCAYQNPNVHFTVKPGFVGSLSGDINASVVSITVSATSYVLGQRYIVSDEFSIDSEKFVVTASIDNGDHTFTLTVIRGWRSTTPASHTNTTSVIFTNCQKTTHACACRGMNGNNTADTFLPTGEPEPGRRNRNYFGGFPVITGYEYGKFQVSSSEKRWQTVGFAGNQTAYDKRLPLVYGRCRLSNPILLIAIAEGTFLSTLWLVAEGTLATNPNNNLQSAFAYLNGGTPTNDPAYSAFPNPNYHLNAYAPDPAPPRGYEGDRYLRVNGALRHDHAVGKGIQLKNGAQDEIEPGGNDANADIVTANGTNNLFFPNATDFSVNRLGLWGTAWAVIRIDTSNNPSVDVRGSQVTGAFAVQYGRCVDVYTSPSAYTNKPTTNHAWVFTDLMASRRAGAGQPYSGINLQAMIDQAGYCDQLVTDTVNGGSVKRYTFNGAIDSEKSYDEWMSLVCMAMSSTKPFLDADGNYKVKALRALTGDEWAAVPVFSDKSATSRNILWDNGKSTLKPFKRRRRDQIPNRIRANYMSLAQTSGYVVNGEYHVADFHINVHNGTGLFMIGDHVSFDGVGNHLVTAQTVSGGVVTQITISPPLVDTDLMSGGGPRGSSAKKVRDGAPVANLSDYAKVQIVIEDEPSQTLAGGGARNIVEKTIDLLGASSLDEAARRATLALRAGEFADGGLSNNDGIRFLTFVKDSQNREIGDVIAVESNQLDAVEQRYYRIIDIIDHPISLPGGPILFQRELVAMLHSDAMYDDGAYTVTSLMPIDAGSPSNLDPPAVLDFSITEAGVIDENGTPESQMIVNFTAPDPPQGYRSMVLMHSTDDGAGAPSGDWSFVAELTDTGKEVDFPITGSLEWFCALSRPVMGHLPNIDTLLVDGSFKYPRVAILVDGMADTPLSTPTGLTAFGQDNAILLKWTAYTGTDARMVKRFNIYRNTVNNSATATKIGESYSDRFIDSDTAVSGSPSTIFYYWIKGVSKLEGATINGVLQSGLSGFSLDVFDNAGTDTAVATAPVCAATHDVVDSIGGAYTFLIGIDRPGGETNWDTVDQVELQIARVSDFSSIVKDVVEELARPPWSYDYDVRSTEYGTYYFRARVKNIFGWSAWSATATATTDVSNATGDTDLMPVPDNVIVLTKDPSNQLTGDECLLQYDVPLLNSASYWGRGIFANDTNTLPSSDYESTGTTGNNYSSYAPSGTIGTGQLTAGSNVLVDLAKTFPTAGGGLVGRQIMVFSPKRPTSGADFYEGAIIGCRVAANTAHTITLELPAEQQRYSGTAIQYMVLTAIGLYAWQKMKWYSGADEDLGLLMNPHASRTRQYRLPSAVHSFYFWTCLFNIWGAGALSGADGPVTITGMSLSELAPDVSGPIISLDQYTHDRAPNGTFSSILTPAIAATADGGREVMLTFDYTQGSDIAQHFLVYYNTTGAAIAVTAAADEVDAVTGAHTYKVLFQGVSPSISMSFGIAAFANTKSGRSVAALQSPASWQNLSTATTNYVGDLGALGPIRVRTTATGQQAFGDTLQYRTDTPPTNAPAGLGASADPASYSPLTRTTITWTYTQGANIATHFGIIVKGGGGTPSLTDQYYLMEANKTSFDLFLPPMALVSLGVFAMAVTKSGVTRNATITSFVNSTFLKLDLLIVPLSGQDIRIGDATFASDTVMFGEFDFTAAKLLAPFVQISNFGQGTGALPTIHYGELLIIWDNVNTTTWLAYKRPDGTLTVTQMMAF